MQIKSNDKMFGLPIMKLRGFFKRYTNNWDIENVMYFFDLVLWIPKYLLKINTVEILLN